MSKLHCKIINYDCKNRYQIYNLIKNSLGLSSCLAKKALDEKIIVNREDFIKLTEVLGQSSVLLIKYEETEEEKVDRLMLESFNENRSKSEEIAGWILTLSDKEKEYIDWIMSHSGPTAT